MITFMTQMSFICVRYADLNNVDNGFMKNYLFPNDHPILSFIRKLENISGWTGENDEVYLHNFFKSPESMIYLQKKNLYDLCRDPQVTELLEVYHYC